jgi:hypothetical protein
MTKKIISLSALALSTVLATGCSTLSDKKSAEMESTDTEIVVMHNYPTRDRGYGGVETGA